ncbi:AzlD domain-containing protein [Paeniglutamicibacter antarcticus]|uniref:AzlD domain-containing protein n=1 Tax=Arthrobacter terrae TaxID=2935737 RepID=A0A931CU73_9MICC|nr:AzlD domain-containing protein [Arthrobacter terrae]MBG0739928.1 AzlD domain-containing protein [Arthrobacter terrae]
MSLWPWILLAAALAFATKLLGYLVPAKVLANPRMSRVAGTLTIGLLAALTVLNTAVSGHHVVADARLGALAGAAVALYFKAPFLLVVVAGAAVAAALRFLGWS